MKIISSEEFLALPSGVLYCNYTHCSIDNLNIKGDTLVSGDRNIDYFYQSLIGDVESDDFSDMFDTLTDAEDNGTEFKLELDCTRRDGIFDNNRMYAIYSIDDVKQLISQLTTLLK